MTTNRRRITRALVAFSVAAATVIPALPALADHNSTTIDVGRANDGTNDDNYDDSDISVMVGTTLTFQWLNGAHDVRWAQDPSSSLVDSAFGAGLPDYQVNLTSPGTYLYYCIAHADASDALDPGADFSNPGDMIGRVTVTVDGTPPGWDPGSATATPISASQIDLTWPTATDDSGSVFFDVYQDTDAVEDGAVLIADNTSGTGMSATGLAAGVQYWYWITPVDGIGNEGTDLTANATTSSVAASESAATVLSFDVNPALSIQVDNAALDFATLSPAAPSAVQSAIVTVDSNDTWSLTVKSTGRDGVDDAAGDDGVFTDNSGLKTIAIDRATWDAGSGANPLTEAGDVVATGQPAGQGVIAFGFQITLLPVDQVGTGYATTVLYTVTQP